MIGYFKIKPCKKDKVFVSFVATTQLREEAVKRLQGIKKSKKRIFNKLVKKKMLELIQQAVDQLYDTITKKPVDSESDQV